MAAAAAKKTSGLGARMAAPANPVAAGMAAVLGPDPADDAPVKGDMIALNVRMPKALHRQLRQLAFDEETSITALLLEAAGDLLDQRKSASESPS